MANVCGNDSMEKVTFNIPSELKAQLAALKDEMHTSFSAIYIEALANYVKQKELEKWQKGAELAMKDKEYRALSEEFGNDQGDLYEY
jgi:predicted transcriptional regulator